MGVGRPPNKRRAVAVRCARVKGEAWVVRRPSSPSSGVLGGGRGKTHARMVWVCFAPDPTTRPGRRRRRRPQKSPPNSTPMRVFYVFLLVGALAVLSHRNESDPAMDSFRCERGPIAYLGAVLVPLLSPRGVWGGGRMTPGPDTYHRVNGVDYFSIFGDAAFNNLTAVDGCPPVGGAQLLRCRPRFAPNPQARDGSGVCVLSSAVRWSQLCGDGPGQGLCEPSPRAIVRPNPARPLTQPPPPSPPPAGTRRRAATASRRTWTARLLAWGT